MCSVIFVIYILLNVILEKKEFREKISKTKKGRKLNEKQILGRIKARKSTSVTNRKKKNYGIVYHKDRQKYRVKYWHTGKMMDLGGFTAYEEALDLRDNLLSVLNQY
jgi:hypothetical protein